MPQKKYGWRIAGYVFKGLCALVIVGVVALLAWRIIDRAIDPKVVKTITPNPTLCEAYKEHGENMTMFYQEQNEYTQEEDNYGLFATCNSLFIKEAKQLQFTLRYNNDTIEKTKERFHLARLPDRDEDLYDVTIVVMYDLTPENKDDNDGKTPEAVRYARFKASDTRVKHQKTLYNYRKFIFDGIEITDDVLAVYADIYYVNDVSYEKKPYGTLLLYNYTDENETYKLTKNDKKALDEAIN